MYKKKGKLPLYIISIVLLLIFSLTYLKIERIIFLSLRSLKQARIIQVALDLEKKDMIVLELVKEKSYVHETYENTRDLSFVSSIPILNGYYQDTNHFLQASSFGINALLVLYDPKLDKDIKEKRKAIKLLKFAKEELTQINPRHFTIIFQEKKVNKLINKYKLMIDKEITHQSSISNITP